MRLAATGLLLPVLLLAATGFGFDNGGDRPLPAAPAESSFDYRALIPRPKICTLLEGQDPLLVEDLDSQVKSGDVTSEGVHELLAARNLLDDCARLDLSREAYILSIRSTPPILIASHSDNGIFYGRQTLNQILAATTDGPYAPALDIVDWPDLPLRGCAGIDLVQGDDLNYASRDMDDLQYASGLIERMATYKLNTPMCHTTDFLHIGDEDAALVQQYIRDVAKRNFAEPIYSMFNVHQDVQRKSFMEGEGGLVVMEGAGAYDEPFTFSGPGSVAASDVPITGYLRNPSFEGAGGWVLGSGWAIEEGEAAFPHDGGTRCLVYTPTPSAHWNRCTSEFMTYPEDDVFTLRVAARLDYDEDAAGDPDPGFLAMVQQFRDTDKGAESVSVSLLPTISLTKDWQKTLKAFRVEKESTKFRVEFAVNRHCRSRKRIIIDYLEMYRMNSAMCYCTRTGDAWPYNIKVSNLEGVPYTAGQDYTLRSERGTAAELYAFPERSTDVSGNSRLANEQLVARTRVIHAGERSAIGPNETVLVSYAFGTHQGIAYQSYRYCPSDPRSYVYVKEILDKGIAYLNPRYVSFMCDELRMSTDCPRCRESGAATNAEILSQDIQNVLACCESAEKVFLFADMFHPWHNGQVPDYCRWYTFGPLGSTYEAAVDLADKGYADRLVWLPWQYNPSDTEGRTAGIFSRMPEFYNDLGFDWVGGAGKTEEDARQWSWVAHTKHGLGVLGYQWEPWDEVAAVTIADYAWTAERAPNPGFEIQGPAGWTLSGAWEWTNVRNGLGMRLTAERLEGRSGVLESEDIPTEGMESWELEVDYRIVTRGDAVAIVRVLGVDEGGGQTEIEDIHLPSADGWSTVSSTFSCAPGMVALRLQAFAHSEGGGRVDLFLDGMSLRPWCTRSSDR